MRIRVRISISISGSVRNVVILYRSTASRLYHAFIKISPFYYDLITKVRQPTVDCHGAECESGAGADTVKGIGE